MPTTTPTLPASAAPTFPRGPLLAIGAVLVASLVGVAAYRLSGQDARAPDAPTVASRLLRFEDGPRGEVVVRDHATGAVLDTLTGEQGFVRGALRALTRDRRLGNLAGPEQPFELAARADGRLTLIDPVTAQRVDLESFGPSNAGAFARLLSLPAPAPGGQP